MKSTFYFRELGAHSSHIFMVDLYQKPILQFSTNLTSDPKLNTTCSVRHFLNFCSEKITLPKILFHVQAVFLNI